MNREQFWSSVGWMMVSGQISLTAMVRAAQVRQSGHRMTGSVKLRDYPTENGFSALNFADPRKNSNNAAQQITLTNVSMNFVMQSFRYIVR